MAKFNEEVCSIILDARSSGMTMKECAGLAGISDTTLYNWLDRGEKAKSGKYRNFYLEYLRANLEFKKFHRDKIAEHKDWHASQYLLQVNENGRYNISQKVESKVEAEVKATVRLSDLFDDDVLNDIIDEDDESDIEDLYDIE